MMDNPPWFLASLQRLEDKYVRSFQLARILSCGGTVGAAFLYAVSENESYKYRALVLSIYLLSSLVFCFVHLEPLFIYGPYVVSVGFFVLIFAALSGKSSRRELVPWLPLFFTTLGVSTTALPGLLRLLQRPQPEALSRYESPVSLAFAHMGPSSQYSPPLSSAESGLVLSNIPPQPSDEWDPIIRPLWPGMTALPTRPGQRDNETASLAGPSQADASRLSRSNSISSDAPLL